MTIEDWNVFKDWNVFVLGEMDQQRMALFFIEENHFDLTFGHSYSFLGVGVNPHQRLLLFPLDS